MGYQATAFLTFFSVTRCSRSDFGDWVSQGTDRDFTDVILMSEDTDKDDEDEEVGEDNKNGEDKESEERILGMMRVIRMMRTMKMMKMIKVVL